MFNSWYYVGYEVDLIGYIPLEVDPPFNPTLVIENDLSFSGEGACNTFSGTFVYDPIENTVAVSTLQRTNNQCQFQSHTDLDEQYIGRFEVGTWDPFFVGVVSSDYLTLVAFNGFGPHFSTSPLLNSEIPDLQRIEVYPNPATSIVYVDNAGTNTRFELIDLNGKIIKYGTYQIEGIEIDYLYSGIYLLKLETEDSVQILKFIKQ
jgi:hypothetical protein